MHQSPARTSALRIVTAVSFVALAIGLGATSCGPESGSPGPASDAGPPGNSDPTGGLGGHIGTGGTGVGVAGTAGRGTGGAVAGTGTGGHSAGTGGTVVVGGTGGAAAPTGTGGHPPVVDAGTPTPDAPVAGAGLHFVVYGDTRTGAAVHQSVVDAYAKLNPQLVLHSGDLWDEYTPAQFKTILTKNPGIAALLNANLFLVARGNHELPADMLAFQPTLVRGNQERYSATVGNSFFVSLGMDPAGQATYLEQQLSSPAAQAATWRFVFSHYPIYSGGPHGGSGNAAIESLCDKYGVAVYFNGHDHLYERSQQMHAQQIADTGDTLSVAKGTVYIVSGGGGAPLYTGKKLPSTHIQKTAYHFLEVTAGSTTVTVTARTPDGQAFDTFSVSR